MIESFHHYTQKLKDLGAIEAVQQHAHKWSEALPWNSKPKPQADEPYVGYTGDATDSNADTQYIDYTEDATGSNVDTPYIDYTEDAMSAEVGTPYDDYTEDPAGSSFDTPYVDYTEDPAGSQFDSPYLDYTEDSAGSKFDSPYVDYTEDVVNSHADASYIDYTEDGPLSSSTTHTSGSATLPGAGSPLDAALPPHAAGVAGSTHLDLPHLQELCHATNWTEGLWLRCAGLCGPTESAWCGGLNNDRTRLQSCLRLAIDAGAGAIIPQVWLRGVGTANVQQYGDNSCAENWFDLAYTESVMRTNCPQLNLRADCPNAANQPVALAPPPETNLEVIRTPLDISGTFSIGEFRQKLILPHLQNAGRINPSSGALVEGATILEYGDTFVAWKYNQSDEYYTVRKDLFKTIQFQKSMYQIGENIRDSQQLQHGSYIAVHLRGESDWPPEWGTAEQQMALYLEEITNIRATDEGRGVSAVFVSSGDQEVIQVFREMLHPLGYTVHDKWTLLADFPSDLALVHQADFDAKGIVDSAVLAGAMYFMGVCALLSLLCHIELVLI